MSSPRTSWRKGSARKRNPNKAKNCTEIESDPAPKPRRRKLRGSSIGSRRLQLPDHEHRDPGQAAEERDQRHRIAPAALRAFDRPEHDRRERDDGDERADRVEARRSCFAGGRDDQQRPGERECGEDDVEREDGRPGEEVQQDA